MEQMWVVSTKCVSGLIHNYSKPIGIMGLKLRPVPASHYTGTLPWTSQIFHVAIYLDLNSFGSRCKPFKKQPAQTRVSRNGP